MKITQTKLSGLLVIEPQVFHDPRGFFYESFYAARYEELGLTKPFVQDNLSRSKKSTLRGLHYQLERPQAKLVSVIRGRVFDVAVDVRQGSPTFGEWFGIELSDANHLLFYIPEGFAHGFAVLSDEADFFYKCSDYYHPASEQGVLWNDPDIGIAWDVDQPILSKKDEVYPVLKDKLAKDLPIFRG